MGLEVGGTGLDDPDPRPWTGFVTRWSQGNGSLNPNPMSFPFVTDTFRPLVGHICPLDPSLSGVPKTEGGVTS